MDGKLDAVLSVGWAGALIEYANPGAVFIASAVIDAETGERFQLADGKRKLVLVTTVHVARKAEKKRLAESYSAVMVDMESATVVRLAEMRGIPVCCIKGISDDVDEVLPDFNAFITKSGQLRMLPFVTHVLLRPEYWRSLIRLGRASSKASHTMASAILTVLSGPKNFDEINRTGNVDW